MTHLFCECEHPIVGVNPDEAYQCHRCGRDVTLFRLSTEELGAFSVPVDESAVPVWDEAGAVDGRLLVALVGAALVVVAVVMFWQWLVGAGVMYAAYRHLTRGTRRRRPRSSVASLMQAGGVLLAGWNSRGLVHRNGRPLRVSVPAKAGREHRYDDIPF